MSKVHVVPSKPKVKPKFILDEIMAEQRAKGENYADWQKEHYPIRATYRGTN